MLRIGIVSFIGFLATFSNQLVAQPGVFEMNSSATHSVFLSSKENYSWHMKKADEAGPAPLISSPTYKPDGWLPAIVPGTVLNSLVHNKQYPEPYYGDNNRKSRNLIPDITDAGSQFYHYWFRTEFSVPAALNDKKLWLKFHGVNYRCQVWLNGKRLGSVAGMFQAAEFDITQIANRTGKNVLAVDVLPVDVPGSVYRNGKKRTGAAGENNNGGDGEIGKNVTMLMSVGWDFTSPDGIRDRNTGIWRDVELYSTGNVVLQHPFVQTILPDTNSSRETVSVEVKNASAIENSGTIVGAIEGTNIRFEKAVTLKPHETKLVVFHPGAFPQLVIKKPKLWWPVNKGSQHLYTLRLQFKNKDGISHVLTSRFGIRQIQSDRHTPDSSRRFIVNGHPVYIRGTNWIPEAMLRTSAARTQAELRYTRQAGFNMVRLWAGGIAESDEFYNMCDELGLLVWNEFWITGDTRFPGDTSLYYDNLRATIKRIRSHPSVAYYVASNESKEIPGTANIVRNVDSTIGYQEQSECCGIHDGSPYRYENPMQYFENTASQRGSRVDGFNPEYGAPCLPLVGSLRQMMAAKDLWPINDSVWSYLDGNGFHRMTTGYREAVNQYGTSNSIEEYANKAQLVGAMNYRAICEVWNYNKFGYGNRFASGYLFWYNNSPLPQTAGRMYDWYLRPTAALYYAQNGLSPLHPQFDYYKNTVSVYNDYRKAFTDYTVEASVYDFNSILVSQQKQTVSIPADGVVKDAIKLDFTDSISQVHFIKLILNDATGKNVADAFYWRSKDAYKGAWTMTGPAVSGFSDLNRLPASKLTCVVTRKEDKEMVDLYITITNNSPKLAFFTQLKLIDGNDVLLPSVFYSDNFCSLLPAESKKITITLKKENWNEVKALSVKALNTEEVRFSYQEINNCLRCH